MTRTCRQLYRAVRRQDPDALQELLRNYPGTPTVAEQVWIYSLVERSAPHLEALLLEAGLHPDVGEASVTTRLQSAACEGHLDRLRLLLHHGAHLERRNQHGETALGYAVGWGQLEAVRLLVEAGAEVNAVETDPESGYRGTALSVARDPEIIAYLRTQGALYVEELLEDPEEGPEQDCRSLQTAASSAKP